MRPHPARPQPTRRRRALKVLASFEPRRRASRIPPRLLSFGAGGLLLVLVLWWLLTPSLPPRPAVGQPSSPIETKVTLTSQPGTTNDSIASIEIRTDKPVFITAVRILPTQPTRDDILKAEVTPASNTPGPLNLSYLWRVNDVPVAQGEVLKVPGLKTGDLVSVTVTPYVGDQQGAALTSQPVRVYSIPPSLNLEIKETRTRVADPLIMQLVSISRDTKVHSFALEEPYLTGMIIEESSGRITWKLPADAKGTYRFGASVTDDEGTKVTKIFEITVQ